MFFMELFVFVFEQPSNNSCIDTALILSLWKGEQVMASGFCVPWFVVYCAYTLSRRLDAVFGKTPKPLSAL